MKKLLPLLLAALLPLTASADWVLSGTSGNVTMTDGTYTLNMTVKSAADRTLMLGRTGNTKSNALPGNSQTYSGSFDFTQRIVDGEDNEWTIVEVAPWAFYNNKAISGTIYMPAVTNIGDAAFGYATGLTGFTLGNKLERIGHGAFVSTFGNLSFTPSLPPSVKFVGQGGIAHHSSWDAGTPMKLSGTIELRGIETLQVSAFYMDINLEKVVIGPKLTEFGTTGTTIDGMANNKGVFERCDKLHTVEWYGPAPASFVQNTFWNNQTTFCVTNYVYIDYFDGWTNAMTACGMSIGSLASGNDPSGVDPADYDTSNPAVYPVASNVKDQKGTIFLSLLPGHPAVAGAPVFNSAPFVTKSNNQFVFHANMDEGEACDLYAVFTDRAGNAVTNALATGVDGDPNTFYTCTPTGLTANKIYSFAVLGTKGSSEVTREGVGTFFNGEVSVTAPAAVSENGGTGVFTFSRGAAADTGVPGGAVTVPFTLSGTATEFDNFREMVRTVTIPEGAASATVPVEAVVNLASGDTTLTLVPDPDGLYLVGTTGTATITDWTPPALADFDSTVIYKVAGYDANKAARWGSTSLNRAKWLTACNYCTNTFLAARMPHMLSQYRARGWYPAIDPPTVVDEQGVRYADGGEVPYGGKVALATTVDGGTVYYTTDGASDPMDAGATVYAGPFAIPDSGFTVRARVLKDGEWSALEEVALEADVPNDQRYGVRIAAIRNAAAVDPDEEFIVLTNVLDRAVPLEGLSIWSEKAGNALVKLAELGEGVEMPAGGTIRLEYADWLNGSDGKKLKLKNGAIYVELRDFNGKRIQNAYVNSEGWFQSVQGDKTTAACNKTGRWFFALEFLGDTDGGEVTEESQWAPSPQPWKKGTLILVN